MSDPVPPFVPGFDIRIEGATRCTSVYLRRDCRWQLILQHNTFVK